MRPAGFLACRRRRGIALANSTSTLAAHTEAAPRLWAMGRADFRHPGRTLSREGAASPGSSQLDSPSVSPELLPLARGSSALTEPAGDLACSARQSDGPQWTAHRPASEPGLTPPLRTRRRSFHRARRWAISSAMVFASANRTMACWLVRRRAGDHALPASGPAGDFLSSTALSANHLAALQAARRSSPPIHRRRCRIQQASDRRRPDWNAIGPCGAGIDAIHLSPLSRRFQ